MTDAPTAHLGSGTPVTDPAELHALRRTVRTGDDTGAGLNGLSGLAVAWVLANLNPVALPTPRPTSAGMSAPPQPSALDHLWHCRETSRI
ncbi:hypothetical protein GCM10023322_52690 [Rugosimonospora acidiphila]|uniref:Uncharacterized protein n=1 Tax=Rugosimonospora acidiphila TaxID=556531 RepID=A0ABP9SB72_9ACTN